ncbi:MAG: class 1b ribonucleoside-diphosphate reductase subunit alpha, partial [Mycoplasmatales bacterium]
MKDYILLNNKVTARLDDGFYDLESDKEAAKLFKEDIQQEMLDFPTVLDKFKHLVESQYYEDFFKVYSEEEVSSLIDFVYSYDFEFQSYMAISKFYESYALKSFDKTQILERYEDRIICVSLYLAQDNIDLAKDLAKGMITQQYQPATPTFLNSGIKNSGQLVSCFLLEFDDSLNSINYNISTAMQLSKIGGGVALNLSKLRARSEDVRNVSGVAKGVLPILKLLEDAFSYVDQLGKRPGAGAAYLNIFHADVIEFLDTKKINADEKSRIQSLSLGLVVPDKFMELAKENKKMAMFYPHNVYKHYEQHLDEMDMNEMYDILVEDPNIRKKYFDTRELLQLIALTQFESGYPYLVYIDTVNRENPLKEIGKIKMSNLCTEIFQIQEVSKINDYGTPDEIGYDISCNLGSLNIVNLMEQNEFEFTVENAIRSLTSVSNLSDIKNAPGISKANVDFHSVGLGVMNLHGYLTKVNIPYESDKAIELTDALFTCINYYSIKASNKMAQELNATFKYFEKSTYATGEYFNRYYDKEFEFKDEKVKELFKDIKLPTIQDWKDLASVVKESGLY